MRTFAIPFGKYLEFECKSRAMEACLHCRGAAPKTKIPKEYAEIAQLVEHNLAKVRVASSSLVFRSKTGHLRMALNFEITT